MAKRKTTKDAVAKDKVNSLLKNVLPTKKEDKPVDVLEQATEDKGNEWLQDQLDALIKENEQLKLDLEKSLVSYHELKNSPDAPVSEQDIRAGVVSLFKDIEDNFLGRNQNRTRYLRADVKILLDKFLGTFPFLMKK